MSIDALQAITPVDGRYQSKVNEYSKYFSEFGLIKYRTQVEIEYFISLCSIPLPQLKGFDHSKFETLRDIYRNFNVDHAQRVKDIEGITNHDVKAVEYFIKEEFDKLGLQDHKEFIHFGLTSQDINNTSIPLSFKDAVEEEFKPLLVEFISLLEGFSKDWADISMLARTHGQPASPTRLGKEMMVFVERLNKQLAMYNGLTYPGKFGGATGNFNAHFVAYPEIDWVDFANNFINNILGLERSQTTTQIDHYDNLSALFDNLKRINIIIIDFCRDIWTYVSNEYFKQKIKKGEVGSSAMPHKVNPIDFENAEGNMGIANAIYEHLSAKLPISRLQRDLTDSTVLRNIGVPMSHSVIAIKSAMKGLNKLIVNEDAISADLEKNIVVIAEGIQTVLRRENYPNPYEALKELTRKNTQITQADFSAFIDSLDVTDEIKRELKVLTPFNYTGL